MGVLLRNVAVDYGGLWRVEIAPLWWLNGCIKHKKRMGTYWNKIHLLPGTPLPFPQLLSNAAVDYGGFWRVEIAPL